MQIEGHTSCSDKRPSDYKMLWFNCKSMINKEVKSGEEVRR